MNKLQQLGRRLAELAFLYSETPKFPLASGGLSQYYIDCRKAISHPDVRELIGELMWERTARAGISAVGGMAIGAYPIALAVSDFAYRSGKITLRAFVVRKESKQYGLKRIIEGDVSAGDRVLVVEDVVTSGGSTIEAIHRCRDAGLEVASVLAVIDRQENNGRANIQAQNVVFDALVTLQDLKQTISRSR